MTRQIRWRDTGVREMTMQPPSWNAETKKAIEESAEADRQRRETEQNNAAARIAAEIKTLSDVQHAQTSHEDANEVKDRAINVATLFLVFLTVLFTFLTWRTLSGQLDEMKAASIQTQRIINANSVLVDAATKQAAAAAQSAETARASYLASQRAWIGPNNARISANPEVGKDLKIFVDYNNFGREPAVNAVFDTDVFTASDDEDRAGKVMGKAKAFVDQCIDMWKPTQGTVVYPSTGGLGSTAYNLYKIADKSLIDSDVVGGKKSIFIDGCFVYSTAQSVELCAEVGDGMKG